MDARKLFGKHPLLGLGALLGTAGLPGVARADNVKARCVVQVVQAHETGDKKPADPAAAPALQLDPKIEPLRPYLSKPPFTTWQKFTLVEEKTFEMAEKGAQTFALPNGKPATLTFLEHVPDAKRSGKHRIRLQLQVGDAANLALSTIFVAREGKVVLQVLQQAKQKGLLVLGTSCAEVKPAAPAAPAAPAR